ncbi:MAG: hypothetical protein H0T76_10010 [Nannocystis sp.]|nr:hypothetical protein [Nannocystis sp.]
MLPAPGATGIELLWSVPEGNQADAPALDPAGRLRSCAGARLGHVEAELRDMDAAERHQTFSFTCAAGNPPSATRIAEPPEIFIDVRDGRYTLDLRWFGSARDLDAAPLLGTIHQTLAVTADTIVPVELELRTPLLPWALDLRGTAACEQLTLEILYADPAADLLDPDPALPAYRHNLRSEQGLHFGGPIPCASLSDGLQSFTDLDRGAYRLLLDIDGRRCEQGFLVDQDSAPLAVDLAKPGCAG